MGTPGRMSLRNIGMRGPGRYRLQLTAYAADGHLIHTWDEAIPGGGTLVNMETMERTLGEKPSHLRIETYFEPGRSDR